MLRIINDADAPEQIEAFMHCRTCVTENARPQLLEVGWTPHGFQVWCKRHNKNIVHVVVEMEES